MNESVRQDRRIDLKAVLAAAVVQAALAYALIAGLAQDFVERAAERLQVIRVSSQRIAEPEPPPSPQDEGDRAERAAGPPAAKKEATQVVAPKPKIALPRPNPIVAAPVAGTGDDPALGAALAGDGTGAGGAGSGPGAGGSGAGGGRKASRVAGALRDSDYPEAAARVRAAGTVFIRFTVGPDGRVGDCTVTGSSGHPGLDALTCRLAERRFRYRPALDGAGRPVAETVGTSFTWGPRE